MDQLLPLAHAVAVRLIERKQTIAVAEGSAGGLISSALLAVPGASAYFLGGAVIYTAAARSGLLGIDVADLAGLRPATEPYAALLADRIRARHNAVWALAESGAAGPTGNRYGDPPGHSCIAVAGPRASAVTLRTGGADRWSNMLAFARRGLLLLDETLSQEE